MTRAAGARKGRNPLPPPEEMEQHADTAVRLLRSLANPHRLMVLCTLAGEELSVSALNERVSLSQSALSQHLAVLREEGLVLTRREAQTVYYSVADGPALRILDVLYDAYCRPPAGNAKKPTRGGRC
jgi:DNA-binding transcriptional ArsR family regulator